MWLFAMFDLPVDTKDARRQYTRFRKHLLDEGFIMIQFSVYARYCPSEEHAAAYRKHARDALPPDGEVRLLSVTDKQFGKMEVYLGEERQEPEEPPKQLMLF
ncbi:MAG: CRISPR-associated endonuclease Cas2 [bacterium]